LNIEFADDKKQKIEAMTNLQQLGFAHINTNTWICPYFQKDETNEVIEKCSLETGVVEIFGEMVVRKDMKVFLKEVFDLDDLKQRYGEFISIYEKKSLQIKQIYEEEQFINGGKALPLLHELGLQFFNITSDDAVLPIQLFPHWEGDEAAIIMKELRELLLEASWKYLVRFE
jgi:phenylacetic acid degradation operon negative regulatory protein